MIVCFHIKDVFVDYSLRLAGEAEAQVVATMAGHAAATVRHTAVHADVVPGAAANYATVACPETCGAGLGVAAVWAVPVAAPFPNIAAHIVYAKLVRPFYSHRIYKSA
jgi:hypothetical protein